MLHNCNKHVINICIGLSTPIVAQYFIVIGRFFRVAAKLILQKVVRLILMIYICKQIIKVKLLQPLKTAII